MRRQNLLAVKVSYVFIGLLLVLPILLIYTVTDSLASTYFTKKKSGVVHYTNIDPKGNGYKALSSPWGTFRGTPSSKRKHIKKFKYSNKFDEQIKTTARWYGVDPLLVKAIIKVESNFNPKARSPKGAMGLMQLMPGTASDNGVSNPYNHIDNIEGGVKYFSKLMEMFNNNITLALAGYNAGEGAVIEYGYKIPPYSETIYYVDKVYAHYDFLRNTRIRRNTKSMVAERKDGKKVNYSNNYESVKPKSNKNSFIYVETLDNQTVISKPARPKQKLHSTKKAKLVVKNNNYEAKKVIPAHNTDGTLVALADSDGRFTVQLASFPHLQIARELEGKLRSKSYPAFIQKVDLPGKGTWYRVRVGKFLTKEKARQFGDEIRTVEPDINSILVTLN